MLCNKNKVSMAVACDPGVDSFSPADPTVLMSHSSFVSLPFGASLGLKIFLDTVFWIVIPK